jgi:hypothetical protein
MSLVSTVEAPAPRMLPRKLIDPAVFADLMISRADLHREDDPREDLLGLRNQQTGELLLVQGTRFRHWLWTEH